MQAHALPQGASSAPRTSAAVARRLQASRCTLCSPLQHRCAATWRLLRGAGRTPAHCFARACAVVRRWLTGCVLTRSVHRCSRLGLPRHSRLQSPQATTAEPAPSSPDEERGGGGGGGGVGGGGGAASSSSLPRDDWVVLDASPAEDWARPAGAPPRKGSAPRLAAAFAAVGLAAALAYSSALKWRDFQGNLSLLPALQPPAAASNADATPAARAPKHAAHAARMQTPPTAPAAAEPAPALADGAPAGAREEDDGAEEPFGWPPNAVDEAGAPEWGAAQPVPPQWMDSTETAEEARADEDAARQAQLNGAMPRRSAAAGADAPDDGGCARIPRGSPAAIAVLRAAAAAQSAAAEAASAAAQAATAAADAAAASARVEAAHASGNVRGEGDNIGGSFVQLDTNTVMAATRTASHAAAMAQQAARSAASAASDAAAAGGGPCTAPPTRRGV